MSNWGALMGAGQGLKGFGSIMKEHRMNSWENQKEELRYQRQEALAKLQMKNQRDMQASSQKFQGQQNKDRMEFDATQARLDSERRRGLAGDVHKWGQEDITLKSKLDAGAAKDFYEMTKGKDKKEKAKFADEWLAMVAQEQGGELTKMDKLIGLSMKMGVDLSGFMKSEKPPSEATLKTSLEIASQAKGWDNMSEKQKTTKLGEIVRDVESRGATSQGGTKVESWDQAISLFKGGKMSYQQLVQAADTPQEKLEAEALNPNKTTGEEGPGLFDKYKGAVMSPTAEKVTNQVGSGLNKWSQAHQGYMGQN